MIIYRLAATAPAAEHRADYSQKESPPDRCTTQCHESISSQPLQPRRVIPLCRLHLALPPPSLQDPQSVPRYPPKRYRLLFPTRCAKRKSLASSRSKLIV